MGLVYRLGRATSALGRRLCELDGHQAALTREIRRKGVRELVFQLVPRGVLVVELQRHSRGNRKHDPERRLVREFQREAPGPRAAGVSSRCSICRSVGFDELLPGQLVDGPGVDKLRHGDSFVSMPEFDPSGWWLLASDRATRRLGVSAPADRLPSKGQVVCGLCAVRQRGFIDIEPLSDQTSDTAGATVGQKAGAA